MGQQQDIPKLIRHPITKGLARLIPGFLLAEMKQLELFNRFIAFEWL